MASPDPLHYFRLKPIQAARVSEISETTAAASVPSEEQINFHIGNPLQDERLTSTFMRIALRIDVEREDLQDTSLDPVLEFLGWDAKDKAKLEFLIGTIRSSIPYMPRGGYHRVAPHALIRRFSNWLEHQQEPLHYDLGEKTARREVILASGGMLETLRVILFSLSDYMQVTPVNILFYHLAPSLPESDFPNLKFMVLEETEQRACEQIELVAKQIPQAPTFVVIGDSLGEESRRKLRLMSTETPVFFIEINNAPNHLSLAREAKLMQRVIRLLSPAIFDHRLSALSPVFVAGNADYLKVFENVHFQLKGTPSASEVQLLTFLLAEFSSNSSAGLQDNISDLIHTPGGKGNYSSAENAIFNLAERVGNHLERRLNTTASRVASVLSPLEEKIPAITEIANKMYPIGLIDRLVDFDTRELLDQLTERYHDPQWCLELQESFLSAFTKHHPYYQPEKCLVVSGSSRTALGILGFNCGITDVVVADLSWSYEQCFPRVHAVPLLDSLALDVDGMIAKIRQLCEDDPLWPQHGAIAINNPHNATGRVFDEGGLRRMVEFCLEEKIYVIDDLAYQNVAPAHGMVDFKTVRQIANAAVRSGRVSAERIRYVITVHAMSKTDCLAGARMAVVEILDEKLHHRFKNVNQVILPNLAAIFICYLFYRGSLTDTRTYWGLRNKLFQERSQAIMAAMENLPANRNPFGLEIIPAAGSMYPLLVINKLPDGLSLDWLASSLARRGTGLLPLSTFARTERGFETGRKAFRLTLGGTDHAEVLLIKTRRLLIDLNRIITEEQAHFNRKQLAIAKESGSPEFSNVQAVLWKQAERRISSQLKNQTGLSSNKAFRQFEAKHIQSLFFNDYLPERLEVFHHRLLDRSRLDAELMRRSVADNGSWLADRLEREFMKDSLMKRQELFRLRAYDRTVHPTQRYSLRAEIAMDTILESISAGIVPSDGLIGKAAVELRDEFRAQNVAISSGDEAAEILLDYHALVAAENYAELYGNTSVSPFLSFWSDWDGSNRPSGQGHYLIAGLVMENVRMMAGIITLIHQADPQVKIPADLISELEALPQKNRRFTQLLDNISRLTQQLEQRYRGILPLSYDANRVQRIASRLHLRRDPVKVLWQHNDRYEQKMLDLRKQRREMLESYFALNKRTRKQLYALIPAIKDHVGIRPLLRAVVNYRDILQRAAITPRIHQATITGRDQFAIDTTVFNIQELNTISGKFGNPGMTLGLQISFSSQPDALISLDRKLGIQSEKVSRENPSAELPPVWLIPLFEDKEIVSEIPSYLDRVWDYATQSRRVDQSPQSRFSDILSEVFIAGSDLSQQISQPAGAYEYLKAKHAIYSWLAEHGVAEQVRIKLGSGEAMQRQGGYYSQVAGQPAFSYNKAHKSLLTRYLPEADQKSTAYAVTPLLGVYLGGDLRTFQSCLSEQLRYLRVNELADLLFHVRQTQKLYRNELIRAVETIKESRLGTQNRNLQELERLTIGSSDPIYDGFLDELTRHFRHILYGREEDVVGIHIVSYFIARSMPQLRDRPTSRPKLFTGHDRGQQLLAYIAEIIPMAKHGSLLRAIAHNQAQTAVLGINQLTTGLFRAINYYSQSQSGGAEGENILAERILPNLPVYEILETLRLYQDRSGEFIKRIENAFPAGNTAFVALREDNDAMQRYIPLFQKELIRRHGLNASNFFPDGIFIQELLPTLRPDLAVLLQADIFNTDPGKLLTQQNRIKDREWVQQITGLLKIPEHIQSWRASIWEVLGESIYQRVQSFAELAVALFSFSSMRFSELGYPTIQRAKLSPGLTDYLRATPADDEMRRFLISAVEYLNSFSQGNIEVPVSIIHALNDVERIAMIEESALPKEKQDLLRFAALQIARLAGDNG